MPRPLAALLALCLPLAAMAEPVAVEPGAFRVVDADTVELDGERIRLTGLDAPETWRPRCAAERARGETSTATLRYMLADAETATLDLLPRRDRYGRLLGALALDGQDVADTLVAARLARPYDGGTRQGWC